MDRKFFNLTDLHGIHLLDYEPYYLDKSDKTNAQKLSCSVLDCARQIISFSKEYKGRIGVLPYSYFGFVKRGEIPFAYENEQMFRLDNLLRGLNLTSFYIPFLVADPQDSSVLPFKDFFRNVGGAPVGFKYHGLALQRPIRDLLGSTVMFIADSTKATVIVHCGNDKFSNPLQIFDLAERYSSIKFIAAHFGALNEDFLSRMKNYENVFVDTSILSHILRRTNLNLEGFACQWITRFGLEDRVVFGSDYPWTKLVRSSPEHERSLLIQSKLEEDLKSKWLFENAERAMSVS